MEKMALALEELKKELPELNLASQPKETFLISSYLKYYDILLSDSLAHIGYFSVKKHRLAAHIFAPPRVKGTVFYLHGYTDHSVSASRLFQYLTQRHFVVATYDILGHGLSDGLRGYINDFSEYVECLEEFIHICRPHLPQPYYLIGHSLGGAVANEYLFSHGKLTVFDKVILLAPLIRLHRWFLIQMKYKFMSRLVKEVPRDFKNSTHNEELLRFVKEADPLQLQTIPLKWVQAYSAWYSRVHSYTPHSFPITMIQGNQDRTVDWRYNCQFIQQKFPSANIAIVPGGRHALFGESEPYWQQTVDKLSRAINESIPLQAS